MLIIVHDALCISCVMFEAVFFVACMYYANLYFFLYFFLLFKGPSPN